MENVEGVGEVAVGVERADGCKCGRCWNYSDQVRMRYGLSNIFCAEIDCVGIASVLPNSNPSLPMPCSALSWSSPGHGAPSTRADPFTLRSCAHGRLKRVLLIPSARSASSGARSSQASSLLALVDDSRRQQHGARGLHRSGTTRSTLSYASAACRSSETWASGRRCPPRRCQSQPRRPHDPWSAEERYGVHCPTVAPRRAV